MPYSYGDFKPQVAAHLREVLHPNARVLDVGPGAGVYADLLQPEYQIDCIEIWEPYVEMFGLRKKYRTVIVENFLTFDSSEWNYLIFGDVWEHFTKEDAQAVLRNIEKNGQRCLVAVPFLFEQGEEFGNVFETHKQPDLTPAVMESRYPKLNCLYANERYGYWVNYES